MVLIASCRTRQGLRPVYRAGRWLLPLVPVQAWSIAKLLAGPVVRFGSECRASEDLAVRMFKETDSLHALGAPGDLQLGADAAGGVRVLQIHGRRDLLIPARRVEADEMIPDGGHLINVTHAGRSTASFRRGLRASIEHRRRDGPQPTASTSSAACLASRASSADGWNHSSG